MEGERSRAEILQGRLYYVALKAAPSLAAQRLHHFFSIDQELLYWNFFLDYGPLSLGQLFRFCQGLNAKLRDPALRDKVIYFYSSTHPHRRANAVVLMAAWSMLYLHRAPEEALRPFQSLPALPPFHDASPCLCSFQLTALDCLRGLNKARKSSFFDFSTFDLAEYEHYEQVRAVSACGEVHATHAQLASTM